MLTEVVEKFNRSFTLTLPSKSKSQDCDFDQWITRKDLCKLMPSPSQDLREFLNVCFPTISQEAYLSLQNFSENLTRFRSRMGVIYQYEFLELIDNNRSALEKFSNGEKLPISELSLQMISYLLKVRFKIVFFPRNSSKSLKLGSENWPSYIVVAKISDSFLPLSKKKHNLSRENSSDLEIDSFFNRKIISDSQISEAESQKFDLSQSNINDKKSSFSVSGSSILENFDKNYFSQCETPSVPNFRSLPYPKGVAPKAVTDKSSIQDFSRFLNPLSHSLHSTASLERKSKLFDANFSLISNNSSSSSNLLHPKFQEKVLSEEQLFRTGFVKFFNVSKDYGFIVSENEEFFLHLDDLVKAGINMQNSGVRENLTQRKVRFRIIKYQGKSKISMKAIDIKFI